ncbi:MULTISPECIES: carboxylesterase/lipase family protein [Phyllobacteriaceae]|jgi:para-nitrobenzyl esterase|uniref:carboxylesterase/lipase family protein n=1 Tax=Mesorhizobium TaxID=68287 RepID=UPI00082437D9|nr:MULTISPECIES: carboxylesterase family protein [Mesorhizobium]MBN9235887.1 carboxylesterase/lipase family protein [Mesorhizobium sp.]
MCFKSDTDIVQTSSGPVVGLRDASNRVERFLGIPYAEPPLGSLRFKPPVPKAPWAEVYFARQFGPASMQISYPDQDTSKFSDDPAQWELPYFGSEDCLSLNIWRPAERGGGKRPLFIWVHGGANHLEGSRSPDYDGTALCKTGDIVFASLNYRLGPFGFLDVSALGGPQYAGSSCNGLRDQLLAIEWIIENASAFGADPDNVTLAGESAGGIDVSWLLASGHLKGRIKRAILMSNVKGPAGFGESATSGSRHDPKISQKIAADLLERLGFADFEALMQADGGKIFERLAGSAANEDTIFGLDSLFYPCVDETFVPVEPFRAIRQGALDGLQLMIGYTNYETGLWLAYNPDMLEWPPEKTARRIGYLSPQVEAEVVGAYRKFFPEEAGGELGMRIINDFGFVGPVSQYAEEAAARGAKVWMYRFDWQVDDRLKAMHSAELPYFFARPNDDAACNLIGPPQDAEDAGLRERLSRIFSGYVSSFVHTGDPDTRRLPDAPTWPAFKLDDRSVMHLAEHCYVSIDPDGERRGWWHDRVYAPIMGSTVASAPA